VEESFESPPVLRRFCLPEFPAQRDGICKSFTLLTSPFDERDSLLEIMLKEMLNETSCDRGPEVRVCMGAPSAGKSPDFQGIILNVLSDLDDRLPARIPPAVRSRPSR